MHFAVWLVFNRSQRFGIAGAHQNSTQMAFGAIRAFLGFPNTKHFQYSTFSEPLMHLTIEPEFCLKASPVPSRLPRVGLCFPK